MDKSIIKEQLNKFLSAISSSQDLGLIIVESKEARPEENFWREFDKSALYHAIDSSESADSLVGEISQAQKENKRVIIDIKTDPYATTISLLKEISQFGKFNVKNAEGVTVERIAVAPGSIICVAERDFIEKEITYPDFYNIFDSAFSLKK